MRCRAIALLDGLMRVAGLTVGVRMTEGNVRKRVDRPA